MFSEQVGTSRIFVIVIYIFLLSNAFIRIPANDTYIHPTEDLHKMNVTEYIAMVPSEIMQHFTEKLFQLCSEINICGILVTGTEGQHSRCCFQCSCEVDCHKNSSCCPHMVSKDEGDIHDQCLNPDMFMSEEKAVKYQNGFRLISTCPQITSENKTELCEHPDTDVGFVMTDVIPVTSSSSLVNYANRHCAECNQAEDIDIWDPELRCSMNPLVYRGVSDMIEEVRSRNDCMILMSPPASFNLNSTKCYIDLVTECNVTGRWETHDSFLYNMCRNVHIVYLWKPTNDDKRYYQNIFCAVCNGEQIAELQECPQLNSENVANAFSTLLSYELPKDVAKEVTGHCGLGQLYDPLTRASSQVNCDRPFILDPHTKECKDVIKKLDWGVIRVPMLITLSKKIQLKHSDLYAKTLSNYISTIFSDSTLKIFHFCGFEIYFKTDQIFKELRDKHSALDIMINEIYVILDVLIEYDFNLVSSKNKLMQHLRVKGVFVVKGYSVQCNFEPHNLDVWVLTRHVFVKTLKLPRMEFESFRADAYSSFSISSRTLVQLTAYCQDYYPHVSPVFDIDFIGCSTFLIDLEAVSLERVTGGIQHLLVSNIKFKFTEFKSVNETHAFICIDSIRRSPLSSSGNLVFGRIGAYLFRFLLFKIHF